MAEKTNANIGFEKKLWDAACVLWGHIPAAEYRKVIIGLIFLRYISAAFDKRYQELVEEGDGFEDDRDAYTMENIFFVPEEARWSTIASAAHKYHIRNTSWQWERSFSVGLLLYPMSQSSYRKRNNIQCWGIETWQSFRRRPRLS